MTDRTFFVRLNLDDMAADIDRLDSTEERGLWLEGFRIGSRGHDKRDEWGFPKLLGHAFGLRCHDEAVIFRDKKVIAGQTSADRRRERNGTAQPSTKSRDSEHCSNGARTVLEHTSEQTPEHHAEQTSEQTPNQPTTNIQQPTTINEQHPLTPKGDDSHDSAEIVAAWNDGTKGSGLPSARNTDKRARVIRTRMKEAGWVEDFCAAVAFIAKSPFHRGDSASKWVADIDYLLQAGKATQIAEKAKATPTPSSGGKAVVKWGGFDQVDYEQSNKECRKDEDGNFYL